VIYVLAKEATGEQDLHAVRRIADKIPELCRVERHNPDGDSDATSVRPTVRPPTEATTPVRSFVATLLSGVAAFAPVDLAFWACIVLDSVFVLSCIVLVLNMLRWVLARRPIRTAEMVVTPVKFYSEALPITPVRVTYTIHRARRAHFHTWQFQVLISDATYPPTAEAAWQVAAGAHPVRGKHDVQLHVAESLSYYPWECLIPGDGVTSAMRIGPYRKPRREITNNASCVLLTRSEYAPGLCRALAPLDPRLPAYPDPDAMEDSRIVVIAGPSHVQSGPALEVPLVALEDGGEADLLGPLRPIDLAPRYRDLILLVEEPGKIGYGAVQSDRIGTLRQFASSLLSEGANAVVLIPRLPASSILAALNRVALRLNDGPCDIFKIGELIRVSIARSEKPEQAARAVSEITILARRATEAADNDAYPYDWVDLADLMQEASAANIHRH
jgi:hypothetical protein